MNPVPERIYLEIVEVIVGIIPNLPHSLPHRFLLPAAEPADNLDYIVIDQKCKRFHSASLSSPKENFFSNSSRVTQ